MNSNYRIKKNSEFQNVFKNGSSTANRQFVVYVLKRNDQPQFRLGLSVSKRIGNAVTRNRVKRLVRESFHQLSDQIKFPYDFVVIARKPTSDMSFEEVKGSLIHVLNRARVLRGSKHVGKGRDVK
ncbi:ribonuclease P protein component [Guptibacillus hwajinpoensis]|uniref:Ribonuclease P protein component n=1 Tax=Guptibacillus hwajinpoensis TaxID=208199 RepID=A0ABU0JYB8_9BACL|nr:MULTISPECIES: ribonuclease P protein component [Alkalihalobacillus]MDP4552974.1 ribonuclease P protein component [Alkalihalobacillus macyae]MDQ0482062.1 ribonuclease P protein component [Alkalihalobacillus hemicentroti]